MHSIKLIVIQNLKSTCNLQLISLKKINNVTSIQQIEDYSHLFNSACAEDMKFFLCTIYAPICIQDNIVYLPPCRLI